MSTERIKRPLNILFIASYYKPYMVGGAEKMLHIHAEGLRESGHHISILTLGPNKSLDKEKAEIDVFRAPVKNVYWPLDKQKHSKYKKAIWHLADCYNPRHNRDIDKVIELTRPDIIICENIAGWSAAIWKHIGTKWKNIPIIQFVHDHAFICIFGIMFRHGTRCMKPCTKCKVFTAPYRRNAKYISEFAFVSQAQQKLFQASHFPMLSSSVIHNAEPIEMHNHESIWSGGKTMNIGLLALLSEAKGVLQLIRAFKLLRGDFHLYLGGNPVSEEFEKEIDREIGSDSRITKCGYVDSTAFFHKIDLAVAPSIWSESFGLTAIEACAQQVPVVASNLGGLAEIIKDGCNGLLCDPAKPSSIADAIQRLYDNPDLFKQLALNAQKSVSEFLSPKTMTSRLEHLCYKLLERTHS